MWKVELDRVGVAISSYQSPMSFGLKALGSPGQRHEPGNDNGLVLQGHDIRRRGQGGRGAKSYGFGKKPWIQRKQHLIIRAHWKKSSKTQETHLKSLKTQSQTDNLKNEHTNPRSPSPPKKLESNSTMKHKPNPIKQP